MLRLKQGHYHLHTQPVSRAKGHSAMAAAAYQSGQHLTLDQQRQFSVSLDHRKGLNKGRVSDDLRQEMATHGITLSENAHAQKEGRRDWTIIDGENSFMVREVEKKVTDPETRKQVTVGRSLDVYTYQSYDYRTREDVLETWFQAPENAPQWMKDIAAKGRAVEKKDREFFWNEVEISETNRNARPARKIQMSFVRELSYEQNKALLQEYVTETFTRHGVTADIAVHQKKASDGRWNTHAHVLITTRGFDAQGEFFADTKDQYWNKKARLPEWRKAWGDKLNGALEENASDTRVDHRSYRKRGLDIKPGEHMGVVQWNRARRGEKTRKGEQNEEIEGQNAKRDQYWKSIADQMRARYPEYTEKDETAYHAKLEREMGNTYEPDKATLDAYNNKQDAAEKKNENRPEEKREHYARKIVKVGFLGSKTTTIYQPGMASLPRKVRDTLDKQAQRLPPAEVQQRLAEHHASTFAGYIANNKSGGSPREALEQLQRVAKTVRDKTAEIGQRLSERYASWRSRVDQDQSQDRRER